MFATRVFILTFAVFATGAVALLRPQEVRYQWKYLNITWSSVQQYRDAVANGDYVPRNNHVSGIKIYKNYMYLTIPRLRRGVPATLLRVPVNPVNGNRSPNVQPYPNLDKQQIGDCTAFQSVKSMEINSVGQMVLIDTGHSAYLESPQALCPPRLVILDLNNNGKILVDYQFPQNVVDPKTSYLNDLVLDHTDGGYAYITNTDTKKPSIVVYSFARGTAWSMSHPSMYPSTLLLRVKNDNETLTMPFGMDGIALSSASMEGARLVYYSPLFSYDLFSIPTDVLKRNPQDFGSEVQLVGRKPSPTDGMMMTANNELYFGLVSDNQVATWNTRNTPFSKYQQRVFEDNVDLMWPDTFAIDNMRNLYVTTNRLEKVINNHVDINQVNFRVVFLSQLNYLSYQYYEDGTAPRPPMV